MAEVVPFTLPETPTITEMDRLADQVRAAVEALAAIIPRLEHPHPSTRARIRAHRTVPREFLVSVIAAVEEIEDLRLVRRFDVDEARETLQFIDAFRPVADQLAAITAALRFTIESRKARVVAAALQTYDIARALSRDEEASPLTGHVGCLKRDLRRGQRARVESNQPATR